MNSADPRIGVVVITYNRRDEVLRSLAKLLDLPERPHVVLVDNGSSDDTANAVACQFPEVEVVLAGANLGAAARNLGVQRTRAPYVALCDDDTWWETGSLAAAANLLDANPRLAVITGCVLVGPQERVDPTCTSMARSPVTHDPGMPGPALLGFLAGASVVRRSAFLEAGGFLSRLFIGGEERWLAVDLAARGWWLCYVASLIVHHYPSPQRDGASRRWLTLRNDLWFAWSRRPCLQALYSTFSLLHSEGFNGTMIRGLASAFSGCFWVLRQRQLPPAWVEDALRRLDSTPAPAAPTIAIPPNREAAAL